MIPPVCFSCGKTCSNLWNKYVELVNSKRKEEENKLENKLENSKKTIECIVLDDLKIKRYCCRRMFLTNIDLSDKI